MSIASKWVQGQHPGIFYDVGYSQTLMFIRGNARVFLLVITTHGLPLQAQIITTIERESLQDWFAKTVSKNMVVHLG